MRLSIDHGYEGKGKKRSLNKYLGARMKHRTEDEKERRLTNVRNQFSTVDHLE